MSFKNLIWPFIYEFFGCVFMGAFIDSMKRTSINQVLLPLILVIPHVWAWKVSRAHLNPAVSLANLLRRDVKFGFGHFMVYIVAQFFGFLAGIMLEWWYYQAPLRMNIWEDGGSMYQYHEALSMEFFGSLALIILHLLNTHTVTALSANWGINATVIGMFYGALVYWGLAWTGGSFNPGYGFGQNMIDLWDSGSSKSVEFIWIYVVFPFLAAVAAWPIYEFIYRPAYAHESHGDTCVEKPMDSMAL